MQDKKILVIDDEPDILKILKFRLEKAGYEVLTALDGIKGLELAVRDKPDLVILDIMMPGGDGYALCEKLRTISGTVGIPVIFLSAKAEPKDIAKGYESGAVYYLTKPYDAEVLLEMVKRALENPLGLGKEREKFLKKILVFTQDAIFIESIQKNFLNLTEPLFVKSIEDFENLPNLEIFDVVVVDLEMRGIDFKKLLKENQVRFRQGVRFVLIADPYLSGVEDIKSVISSPCAYLRRPFEIEEIVFNLRS
ncbi:MAG: response regulator [Candidatus Omnitrophica bacterium]|nr:response regulator [Candidatus Omnitrophota bacterium]